MNIVRTWILATAIVGVLSGAALAHLPAPGAAPLQTPTPTIATDYFPVLSYNANTPDLPGLGWWTGEQIQNTGTADAAVVVCPYDPFPPQWCPQYYPLPPGTSVTFLPADFVGMGPGFLGSGVASADQPIAAIVTLTNRQTGVYGASGGLAAAQYQAGDAANVATTLRFSIAKNRFGPKTTTLFVQNAGSAAATVTANYLCGDPPLLYSNTSTSINPGQMVAMHPAAAGVPVGSLCSARMTSSQPLAGVAAEYFTDETVATLLQASRGLTPADASTTLYAPIFKKRFPAGSLTSRTTGARVQNAGSSPITVTATYAGAGTPAGPCPPGWSWSETSPPIDPNASYTFLYPVGMPDDCLASARFVAAGPIVGVVNEAYLDPQPGPGVQSATAYNLLPSVVVTQKLVAPLFKYEFGGKTSGLLVQNVGVLTATLHVEYRSGANLWQTNDFAIPAGGGLDFSPCPSGPACWNGAAMPTGTNASATVIADQPIAGIVAERPYTPANPNCYGQANGPCYDRQNYEVLNLAP
jgi:hypothetical protein